MNLTCYIKNNYLYIINLSECKEIMILTNKKKITRKKKNIKEIYISID